MTDEAKVSRQIKPKPKLEPGRQSIAMSSGDGAWSIFGGSRPFDLIPETAGATRWEDCHDFGRHAPKPVRDPIYGLRSAEPPLALVCVECGLKQPVLNSGDRDCPYCGLHMKLHGSLIYHWRDDVKPTLEWKP